MSQEHRQSAPTRTAQCGCGALRVTVVGEPALVAICSCSHCQRRTGSVLGVSAYFDDSQVLSCEGEERAFRRGSDRGRWLENRFCPTCGTTVYWVAEFQPGRIGVAAGCFADSNFPAPEAAVWDGGRPRWLPLPDGCPSFDEQRS